MTAAWEIFEQCALTSERIDLKLLLVFLDTLDDLSVDFVHLIVNK